MCIKWGPSYGRGDEQGSRVWYPMKVLNIKHNLFAGTDTQSLRLQANRHARFVWKGPPFGWGLCAVLRGGPLYYAQFVCWNQHSISPFTSQSLCQFVWGIPQLGWGLSYGVGCGTP